MRVEKRQKVTTYDVYIASDGKEFDTEDACKGYESILNGTRKVCPECDGKGYISEWVVEANYHTGAPEEERYDHICPKCQGKGYLEKVTVWR